MSRSVRVPGKFVLCGEHAVLRGHPAVALPHPEFFLDLSFTPTDEALTILPPPLDGPVRAVLDKSLSLGLAPPRTGRFDVISTIPVGAGLGSSAALCVALAETLDLSLATRPNDLIQVATRLEDCFHGTSSGMDIAVCVAREPIEFVRGHEPRRLALSTLPKFSFHDSGLPKKTKDSVAAVAAANRTDLDRQMGDATAIAIEGLSTYAHGRKRVGLDGVALAMNQAMICFEEWGLIPPQIQDMARGLLSEGALAVKLTGAGGGGYLVALWND